MAETFISKDDRLKNISEGFVAVDGRWKHISEAFVSKDEKWKSTWSGEPDVNALSWDRSGSAPWTRLVAGYSVTGLWSSLTITMVWYNGTRTVLAQHGQQPFTGTVAQSGIETGVLTPSANYRLEVEWVSLSGTYKVIASRDQTTVAPPIASNFWVRGPVTHNQGGIEWTSFRDIQDWHSVRNNDGKAWHHGGDIPYIYEYGLGASSTYYYQTQCLAGGVWGSFSAQQYFTTAGAPYTPGEFQFWPNGNSQTWQSSGADWQGNSRDWWYHANGTQWGSSRGNQLTCIYYSFGGWEYDNVMNAIRNGGQITRTRVYVHRAAVDAGLGGPVQSLVALNGAHFANNPWNVSGNQGGPALAKGQGAWVDVPAHWGRHLFEVPGTYTGWILGDSSNSNNYMALGKNNYSTGNMLINIA